MTKTHMTPAKQRELGSRISLRISWYDVNIPGCEHHETSIDLFSFFCQRPISNPTPFASTLLPHHPWNELPTSRRM